MPNKIGWCDMTWNPVWGCRNKCEYCYARSIAKRFGIIRAEEEHRYTHKYLINSHIEWKVLENRLKNFKLIFLESQFNKKLPKKPQRIFVGSMSEIAHWKDKWVEMVIEKVKQYPQHTFQFLTKFPEVYSRVKFPKNCWLGTTITKDSDLRDVDVDLYDMFLNTDHICYLSIEPIHGSIKYNFIRCFDWIILGAETGNRKGKVISQPAWIDYIVDYCIKADIPIYLKDSLKDIYPVEIKEFPKGGGLIEGITN